MEGHFLLVGRSAKQRGYPVAPTLPFKCAPFVISPFVAEFMLSSFFSLLVRLNCSKHNQRYEILHKSYVRILFVTGEQGAFLIMWQCLKS